jgi:hypothetical protein
VRLFSSWQSMVNYFLRGTHLSADCHKRVKSSTSHCPFYIDMQSPCSWRRIFFMHDKCKTYTQHIV